MTAPTTYPIPLSMRFAATLLLFCSVGCGGGGPETENWKSLTEEFFLRMAEVMPEQKDEGEDCPEDGLLSLLGMLRPLISINKEFGPRMAEYSVELVEVSSGTDTEDLKMLCAVVRFLGNDLPEVDRILILDNLYNLVDPRLDDDLLSEIFNVLQVNRYDGDLTKAFDAISGKYPESCHFDALSLLVSRSPPIEGKILCPHLKRMMDHPVEIVAAVASLYYEKKLPCADLEPGSELPSSESPRSVLSENGD